MFRSVIAIKIEGLGIDVFSILFEVPYKNFDLLAAAKAAVADFCKTPEGRTIYSHDFDYFDWGDFSAVPNEICEKYGFRKVEGVLPDKIVDWEESLAEDFKAELMADDEEEEKGAGTEAAAL